MKKFFVYFISFVVFGFTSANAVTELRDHYVGLSIFSSNGQELGRLYQGDDYKSVNIFGRYANDNLGDRLQVSGKVRDLNIANSNGVYAEVRFFANDLFCYPSNIGVGRGAGSIGITCFEDLILKTTKAKYANDEGSPQTFTLFHFREAGFNTQVAELRVCQDNFLFLPDPCSGPRVLGIDWDQ